MRRGGGRKAMLAAATVFLLGILLGAKQHSIVVDFFRNSDNDTAATATTVELKSNASALPDNGDGGGAAASSSSNNINENNTNTTTVEALQYHRNPMEFVETLASCILDNNDGDDEYCSILYHHVPKSGGTTIQGVFNPLNYYKQQEQEQQQKRQDLGLESCCIDFDLLFSKEKKHHASMMVKFRNDTVKYCESKFSGYEIYGKQFEDVVSTCVELALATTTTETNTNTKSTNTKTKTNAMITKQQKRSRKRRRRFVALSSYREPVSRTVSFIHQICNCNKNKFKKRPPNVKRACVRCRYNNDGDRDDNDLDDEGDNEDDTAIWNDFAKETVKTFEELDHVNRRLKSNIVEKSIMTTTKRKEEEKNGNAHDEMLAATATALSSSMFDADNVDVDVDVLMIDLVDLNDFFYNLDAALVAMQQKRWRRRLQQNKNNMTTTSTMADDNNNNAQNIVRLNLEKLNQNSNRNKGQNERCKFEMPPPLPMMKLLEPAVTVYRDLKSKSDI